MQPATLAITIALAVAALAIAALAVHLVRRHRRRQEIFIKFNTMSGSLLVYTIKDDDGNLVRVMDSQGAYESATYLDDDKCYELVFDYHRFYNHVFDPQLPVRSMLMLGGGGFAYPEYVVNHYPDIKVDVVEIDPAVIAIARRYFFLDRLIEEFDTEETGRLEVVCADAREFLDSQAGLDATAGVASENSDAAATEFSDAADANVGVCRYDAVFNDCFLGRTPVMSLASVEAAESIKRCLNPGGVYMSNVISSLDGEDSTFLSSIVATLQEVFAHVYVVAGGADRRSERENNVVIATDGDQVYRDVVEFSPAPGAEVFRDDLGKMYEKLFYVEDK